MYLTNCSNSDTPKKSTYDILNDLTKNTVTSKTKAIIVINDRSCGTCNQKFCNLMYQYVADSSCKFILSANENNIDISLYKKSKTSNVFIDKFNTLFFGNIVSSSTIFFLKNHTIDTLLEINPENFDSKINYITRRLNLLK